MSSDVHIGSSGTCRGVHTASHDRQSLLRSLRLLSLRFGSKRRVRSRVVEVAYTKSFRMPIVQIHLPKNAGDEATLERIRVACRQHVLDTLSADRAHHDYVTVLEVLGKMGDGCPLVKVDQRPGREKWRKEAFSKRIPFRVQQQFSLSSYCPPRALFATYFNRDWSNWWYNCIMFCHVSVQRATKIEASPRQSQTSLGAKNSTALWFSESPQRSTTFTLAMVS